MEVSDLGTGWREKRGVCQFWSIHRVDVVSRNSPPYCNGYLQQSLQSPHHLIFSLPHIAGILYLFPSCFYGNDVTVHKKWRLDFYFCFRNACANRLGLSKWPILDVFCKEMTGYQWLLSFTYLVGLQVVTKSCQVVCVMGEFEDR